MILRRWLWLVVALASCRQIIGIEEAEIDPSLSAGAGGAASRGSIVGEAGAWGGAGDDAGAPTGGGGEGQGGEGQGGEGQGGEAGAGGQPSPVAGAGTGGVAAEPETLCEQYCSTVQANCTGEFAVYTSASACHAVCAAMPAGTPGEREGNSVHCRLRAAQSALDEVPHYCPIAGPGGHGVCGSNCESLCELRQVVCAPYISDDVASCRSRCDELTELDGYSTALERAQYAGDHVQCRLYHLSAAASDDPERHCPHADGTPPCQ